MTDQTRKGFLNWLQQPVADMDCNVFQALIGHCDDDAWFAWQAATAQSAEKMARLEAELEEIEKENEQNVELRDELAKLSKMRLSQAAAAELSNKQLREALFAAQGFIHNGIELGYIRMPDAGTPDPAHETPRMIAEALIRPISTEALDAYVAEKMPAWRPIETAPKDGTTIDLWVVGHIEYRCADAWWSIIDGKWVCEEDGYEVEIFGNPTHWMPLPLAPEKE